MTKFHQPAFGGGAVRAWNGVTDIPTKNKPRQEHHERFNERVCRMANNAGCGGSVMAHSVELLPGIVISFTLCDTHMCLLERRAREVTRIVAEWKELKGKSNG